MKASRIASFDAPRTWIRTAWPEIDAINHSRYNELWARQPLSEDELAWVLRCPKIVKSRRRERWAHDERRDRARFVLSRLVYPVGVRDQSALGKLFITVTNYSYSITLHRKERVAGLDMEEYRPTGSHKTVRATHFQIYCKEDPLGRGHERFLQIENIPTSDPLNNIRQAVYAFSKALDLRFKYPQTSQSLHMLTKPRP